MTNKIEDARDQFPDDPKYSPIIDKLNEAYALAKDLKVPEEFFKPKSREEMIMDILDALTPEEWEFTNPTLAELSAQFREKVGGILPDETPVKSLFIPDVTDKIATAEIKEKLLKANRYVRRDYIRAMHIVSKRFDTLGEFRQASQEDLEKINGLGKTVIPFLTTGFVPLPQTRGK